MEVGKERRDMANRVTIIGLGCVGTSIGLALRQHDASLEVVGHDKEASHARQADQMGAVNKTEWNLFAACKGARIIILALPLDAVRETLELLGPELEEGTIVTDTARLKVPVLKWANEYLPETVHFVSGVPIPGPAVEADEVLSGPEAARADLFKDGLYCIASDLDSDTEAVGFLVGLARAIGAQPLFLDPLEYDGLQAGAADLPALLAVAMLQATVGSPGWQDMRKVAGYEFATFTRPVANEPLACPDVAMLNRENILRRLDMFVQEVSQIRQQLAEGDEQALVDLYGQAAEARERWLAERRKGQWGEMPEVGKAPSAGDQVSRMLFGGLFRRRRPEEKE